MRLCCSANASGAGDDHTVGLVKNEKGQPANFGRETPMSAWNNEYMKDVRLTMLEGKIPSSCSKCIAEESRGVASKRIWETGSWMEDGIDVEELIKQTEEDGTVPEKLVYLLRRNKPNMKKEDVEKEPTNVVPNVPKIDNFANNNSKNNTGHC